MWLIHEKNLFFSRDLEMFELKSDSYIRHQEMIHYFKGLKIEATFLIVSRKGLLKQSSVASHIVSLKGIKTLFKLFFGWGVDTKLLVSQDVGLTGFIVFGLSLLRGFKYIVQFHHFIDAPFFDKKLGNLRKTIVCRAAGVRFVSNHQKEALPFPLKKIRSCIIPVMPNRSFLAYPEQIFLEKKGGDITSPFFRFCYFGRLEKEKGVENFQVLFTKINKVVGPDGWSFTIVGEGTFKQRLIRDFENSGFSKNVNFIRGCNGEPLVKWVAQSNVNIILSPREGFGRAPLEGFLLGLPCVYLAGSGVENVVSKYGNGFCVDPASLQSEDINDVKLLIKKIALWLKRPSNAVDLKKVSRDQVKANMSLKFPQFLESFLK